MPGWTNLNAISFAEKLRNEPETLLLDVRMPAEFHAGHLEQAWNLDIYRPDIVEELLRLPLGKPVFVYCAHGIRSIQVCRYLASRGYKELYNLTGGYMEYLKTFTSQKTC